MKNSDSARNLLLILYEIEKCIGKIAFWNHSPDYRIVGPSGDREYLYREGDHILWICIEWLFGESEIDVIIYTDSVHRWDPPYDREIISEEKRQEILQRLAEQLTKGKARFRFQ